MPLTTLGGYADDDYPGFVEALAVPHRRREAEKRLLKAGTAALDALETGLEHESPDVVIGCLKVLDHFLHEDALPALFAKMRHPHPGVRGWALHALACDRCKEGACRPGEDEAIPVAIDMLQSDPSHRVRMMAADMLGPSAIRDQAVTDALVEAAEHDPHPNVRKKAKWFVPGGPVHRRHMKKAKALGLETL